MRYAVGSIVPFDLRGLPFTRRPTRSLSFGGTLYIRWASFDMPQLGDYKWIMDIVFFLYPTEKDARLGTRYGGTGFLVAIPSERWSNNYFHVHGVTNWHVAMDGGASVIRINRRDGGPPDIFSFDPSEWTAVHGGHDIAISPPLPLDPAIHKAEAVGRDAFLTKEEAISEDVGSAEDVFMIGRFIDYSGAETNVPAFRFGNISIYDAEIKQPTGYTGKSIVLDMHSRTGFSGSPVFMYRTPGTVFAPFNDLALTWHYVRLVGMHWGQFPEQWELKAASRPHVSPAVQASLITEGSYVEGLSGMTCATPASAILKLLEDQNLKQMRESVELALEPEMTGTSLRPKPMHNVKPSFEKSVQEDLEASLKRHALSMAIVFGS